MKLSLIQKKVAITIICFPLIFSACSAKTGNLKKYGVDADYFFGLKEKKAGNETKARKKFANCAKKGSFACARKSAQELTTFGSAQEKIQASLKLAQQFEDSSSQLIAAKQLFSTKEYKKLLQITEKIDILTAENALVALRLKAQKFTKSPQFNQDVFTWFTGRNLTQVHYDFYKEFMSYPDFDAEEVEVSVEDFVLNFRTKVYSRDYLNCLNNAEIILNYFETGLLPPIPQLASDLGKVYLYGSKDYINNAKIFHSYALQWENTELEHYFWFYAGRLFQKSNSSAGQIKYCFEKAVESAKISAQKDNAIWYLLDSAMKFGLDSATELLKVYAKQWTDAEYFDDYFDNLSVALLGAKRWDDFYEVYNLVDGYATDEMVAQYAYIYGRLVEEGLAGIGVNDDRNDDGDGSLKVQKAYKRALRSGTSAYYRILAAYRLEMKGEALKQVLCQGNSSKKLGKYGKNGDGSLNSSNNSNSSSEKLLLGYADFGFPELIYENYIDFYKEGISTETSIYLANYLKNLGNNNHEYLTQSLRITSRAVNYGSRDCTPDELKFFYPVNYIENIKASCERYEIDEAVMLALIRSESFFAPDVKSSAGAVGLCQLMETTAADIARKLKITDYQLTDSKINIEFGTYYLAELYRRCNNSYLQAFLSYNAGITRVRRWAKTDLPADLFLETVPYTETRGYGRKLISATAMYEWLYSQKDEVFYNRIGELLE